MKLEDLLKIKLEQDLLNELSDQFNLKNITKGEYLLLCKQIIKGKIKDFKINDCPKFLLEKKVKCKYPNKDRCCARIWDSHYGTRCKYKRNKTDYCNHHNGMIKRAGKLTLNRYDEDKPIFNEKGNRYPWFTNSNVEILDSIIQKQQNSLLKLINKERQITPKI